MKGLKKWFRTPAVTAAALIVAIGLLAFAGIGTARAAWNASEAYKAEVSMKDIGVTLLENGTPIAQRDYVFDKETKESSWTDGASGMLTFASGDESKNTIAKDREIYKGRAPILNKKYDETVEVENSGAIGEYVRVSIYRYWLDENGKKKTDLSPKLIELYLGEENLDEAAAIGGWAKDGSANTDERIVLYYQGVLPVGGKTSPVFDHIAVSNRIAEAVGQKTEGNTITTTYKYDGCRFCLEVTADAVQDHHAAEAIRSAWGVDPSLAGLAGNE